MDMQSNSQANEQRTFHKYDTSVQASERLMWHTAEHILRLRVNMSFLVGAAAATTTVVAF